MPLPRKEAIEEVRFRYRVEAELLRLKSPTGPTGHYAGQFQRMKALGPLAIPILLDIVADRARPLPGESAAGPYAAIHPDMESFDPQELRGMAAYGFSEIVEKNDRKTIAALLRLHDEYMALDEDEHPFERESLGPSIAFSLFDIGEPRPAREYVAWLRDTYDGRDPTKLWDLGYACIRMKQYEEGEAWYKLVLEESPSKAIAAYNLACNFAMRAREAASPRGRDRLKGDALHYLRLAIEEFGYGDWKWMEEDGDLDFIRAEPAYRELLRHLQRKYPERKKGKVAKGRSALAPK
jgi:hypothetical protein